MSIQSTAIGHGWQRPKLTPKQRDDIIRRKAEGERPIDLAREYGVSTNTIYRMA